MASAVLTQGNAEKAVGDSIRCSMDFGNEPKLISLLTDANGDFNSAATAIASFDVACTGATGTPPTVSGKQQDYTYQISAKFSGGTPGQYNAVFTIVLNDADATTLERTGALRVY